MYIYCEKHSQEMCIYRRCQTHRKKYLPNLQNVLPSNQLNCLWWKPARARERQDRNIYIIHNYNLQNKIITFCAHLFINQLHHWLRIAAHKQLCIIQKQVCASIMSRIQKLNGSRHIEIIFMIELNLQQS